MSFELGDISNMVQSQPEIDIATQLLTPRLDMFEEIESACFDNIQSDKTVSHVQAASRSCVSSLALPRPHLRTSWHSIQ